MKVLVMRGIPGSGKSTLANKIAAENAAAIVSADDYFVVDGKYTWNPDKLSEAHRQCMRRFLDNVLNNEPCIIVDNTNINVEDAAPYIAIGEAMGYDVEIVQVTCDPAIAAKRNVHSVKPDKVLEMARRLERIHLPKRWKVRDA